MHRPDGECIHTHTHTHTVAGAVLSLVIALLACCCLCGARRSKNTSKIQSPPTLVLADVLRPREPPEVELVDERGAELDEERQESWVSGSFNSGSFASSVEEGVYNADKN